MRLTSARTPPACPEAGRWHSLGQPEQGANSIPCEAALDSGGDGGGNHFDLALAGYAMHHRSKCCARVRIGFLWLWQRPQPDGGIAAGVAHTKTRTPSFAYCVKEAPCPQCGCHANDITAIAEETLRGQIESCQTTLLSAESHGATTQHPGAGPTASITCTLSSSNRCAHRTG